MKTIIAGSRTITDDSLVKEAILESGFDISCVICGLVKGVDLLGADWAVTNKKTVQYFPANWKKHGKAAGYIRNVEMADVADALIAVWNGQSRGTKHVNC